MEQTCWVPDVLDGFEQCGLSGYSESSVRDGPPSCVLVRRRCASASAKAVLYIHGYVDYFFQTHLADFYNRQGLHFYALDLRRHGRAMRPHQLPNYTSDVNEYLQDVDAAIAVLQAAEQIQWLLLNGHSTGGLVAALYAHRGTHRTAVNAVFLNSPFLDMNLPAWQQWLLEPVLAATGRWLPRLRLPALSVIYGQSLHAEHHGAWQYNTDWKPIAGFPVYAGWFRAIHRAHAEIARGLSITCPVLVMHAEHSAWPRRWSPEVMATDIVLDVSSIRRLSPRLGQRVEVLAISRGVHDLTLSDPAHREKVFDELEKWLRQLVEPHVTLI